MFRKDAPWIAWRFVKTVLIQGSPLRASVRGSKVLLGGLSSQFLESDVVLFAKQFACVDRIHRSIVSIALTINRGYNHCKLVCVFVLSDLAARTVCQRKSVQRR